MNEHERENAAADHLPKDMIEMEVKELGKPHISRAMRALLKKNGRKGINVKELAQQQAGVKTTESIEEVWY